MFLWVGVPLNMRCSSRCAMPVSPYRSLRDPTLYVTLTVVVGLVGSGKSRTSRPLGRRYSVIPSTEATGTRAAEAGFAAAFARGPRAAGAGAAAAKERAQISVREERTREDLSFIDGTSFDLCTNLDPNGFLPGWRGR